MESRQIESQQKVRWIVFFSVLFLWLLSLPAFSDVAFEEGFETGGAGWSIDNGVWEIGTPTSGPGGRYTSSQCAATVLTGNYPAYDDSRLISPSVSLPSLLTSEELHLRFQHWFRYSTYDSGQVQVSVWDGASSTWGV